MPAIIRLVRGGIGPLSGRDDLHTGRYVQSRGKVSPYPLAISTPVTVIAAPPRKGPSGSLMRRRSSWQVHQRRDAWSDRRRDALRHWCPRIRPCAHVWRASSQPSAAIVPFEPCCSFGLGSCASAQSHSNRTSCRGPWRPGSPLEGAPLGASLRTHGGGFPDPHAPVLIIIVILLVSAIREMSTSCVAVHRVRGMLSVMAIMLNSTIDWLGRGPRHSYHRDYRIWGTVLPWACSPATPPMPVA